MAVPLRKRMYVNLRMLLRIIGWLILMESAFMCFPLITAIIYHDHDVLDFAISTAITASSGSVLIRIRPRSREMGKREAILLTVLTWVILSLFGMIPFLLSGAHNSVTDAFFESMNGFTTTGGSALASVNGLSHSVLLWRSIQQWIGGMGIILFTIAVAPMLNNQGGMFLFNAEVTGITHDKLRPRISSTAKGLWIVYICLTAALVALLSLSKMSFFEAVCNGLSTMSTGGFSTSDINIQAWDSLYVKTVILIFMILGGINFSLMFNAFTGRFTPLLKNNALHWYLGGIFIAYILLSANILINGKFNDISDITIDPLFQAASVFSSTGITEPGFHDWGALSIIILVVMMFVGGSAGSTSGGAKVDRVIILVKFLKNEFYKMMHPNTVTSVSVNGKGISYVTVQKVLAFLCLYIMVIFMGGILLVITGMSLRDSFFLCLSSISNTWLSTNVMDPSGAFPYIPDAAKWILSLVMLVGRLEIYTVLLIFTPIFWKK